MLIKPCIRKNIALAFILLLAIVILVPTARAQGLKNAFNNSNTVAVDAGYNTTVSAEGYISKIISIVLSILGVLFLILMIYGGFLWMTAQGKEDQITRAKNLITAAVVGVIIVVSAYAITYFVIEAATNGVIKPGA